MKNMKGIGSVSLLEFFSACLLIKEEVLIWCDFANSIE